MSLEHIFESSPILISNIKSTKKENTTRETTKHPVNRLFLKKIEKIEVKGKRLSRGTIFYLSKRNWRIDQPPIDTIERQTAIVDSLWAIHNTVGCTF